MTVLISKKPFNIVIPQDAIPVYAITDNIFVYGYPRNAFSFV